MSTSNLQEYNGNVIEQHPSSVESVITLTIIPITQYKFEMETRQIHEQENENGNDMKTNMKMNTNMRMRKGARASM